MKNRQISSLVLAVAVLGSLIMTGLTVTTVSACYSCGGSTVTPVQPVNNTYTTNNTYNTGGNVNDNNTNTNNNSTTNSNVNTNNNTNSNNISINIGGYAQAAQQQTYYQQPNVNTLVCSPSNQNTGINQTAVLSATGGDGNYTWTVAEVGQTSYGTTLQVSYAAAGLHTVTVRSAGQVATCSVNVTGGQVLGTIDFPNTGEGGWNIMDFALLALVFGLISLAIFYFERRTRLN